VSTTEIIYGFAGLLAGAILTGAMDAITQWHARRLEKRAAARAIFGDLHWAHELLKQALSEEDWSQIPSPPTEDWVKYRDALSNGMSGTAFHTVGGAYHDLLVLDYLRRRKEPFNAERCEDAIGRFEEAEEVMEDEGLTRRDKKGMQAQRQYMTSRGRDLAGEDDWSAIAADGEGAATDEDRS
jgi:hypothetical protein